MAKNIIKSKNMKVPLEFEKEMTDIMKIRMNKGFIKNSRERGFTEQVRLLRKTEGYKLSLDELSFKPKRRNGR